MKSRALMPCNALVANPRAQISPANLYDVLDDDWVIPCLDGTSDNTNQSQAFNQAPLVKMRPPQQKQYPSWAASLYKGTQAGAREKKDRSKYTHT